MDTSIFLLGPDEQLTELHRAEYHSEDLFQHLLAQHPALLRLAGGAEGRLLLIRREQPVPDRLAGSGRWSLDHLFLDREGVPVLVEVKQASDTRARREVVAQMLDYAANLVAYWPVDRIVAAFNETAERGGEDPDAFLAEFLGGSEAEIYWRQVESNLRSGRVRMLFVADRVSKELGRIIEFLNEQMRPAEVLAIEVEQFRSADGIRTLVPRLVGATERAQTAKAISPPADQLSEAEWLYDLEARFGTPTREAAEKLIAWFRSEGLPCEVTRSQDAIAAAVRIGDKLVWPFFIRRSTGRLEVSLQNLARTRSFADENTRRALMERMRGWAARSLKIGDRPTGWPSMELGEIADETLWAEFTTLVSDVRRQFEMTASNRL